MEIAGGAVTRDRHTFLIDWAEVPSEAGEALRPLYGDEDLQQFAWSGSYIGYRVGIADAGDWLYVVAGD